MLDVLPVTAVPHERGNTSIAFAGHVIEIRYVPYIWNREHTPRETESAPTFVREGAEPGAQRKAQDVAEEEFHLAVCIAIHNNKVISSIEGDA